MKRKVNPIFNIDSIKVSHSAQYPATTAKYTEIRGKGEIVFGEQAFRQMILDVLKPNPLDPFSYMKNPPQIKAQGYKGSLTLDDLIVLYVCGDAVLKTMPELKGDLRRKLQRAVNHAKKDVGNL